ncbi:hypothetical protein SAMN02982929_00871 [Saccharopolyspora kobensis]|uniref:Uncharacterized protein n=1 Tax=Saccharopolyspora kobensis TaxID=146035 RepID=A0A1H5VG49_9PSEU|nr:hypothetical protein [Saccharopolyspora kobensis]SEF86180.1 hypothetical protein SAMN02982929_00871 [Saccharopolyspora kobensis]SFC61173.1 hypothetical protein SAMN05216506_1011199 [Saccharopolyspora kobensis]
MSEESEKPTTKVSAEPGATVGIVADSVHNSTVYVSAPADPPARKYEVGLKLLDGGTPGRARDLIGDAIAHDFDSAEVRFHWILALLSKRSYRDLNAQERDQLDQTSKLVHSFPEGEWKRALSAVCKLLDATAGREADMAAAIDELFTTPAKQRDKIMRHLDLVLTGGMKDRLWAQAREAAKVDQVSNDRFGRVWAYFHPVPARPRIRPVASVSITDGDQIRRFFGTTLFLLTVGYLGWLVLLRAEPIAVIAYLLALVAGYVAARNALEWRYRTLRMRTKEQVYFGPTERRRVPEGGFANRVDQSFDHYFSKYAPDEENRQHWLSATAGVRNELRNEIVEIYRETRISIGEINWLIGYLVLEVRKRWRAGTLFDFQQQYRTSPSTKAWCLLSLVAAIPAAAVAIIAAFQAAPLPAVAAAIAAGLGGRTAAQRGFHIIAERRRYAEESLEQEREFTKRVAAYDRWERKLDSIRPGEDEMETWLIADKTLLVDKTLRHYRLAWRDIIAHSFLQTRATGAKRARFEGCPWRYSKYDIRLFLVSLDGVREISTELNFETGSFNGEERSNYRFDAVSSVHVATTSALKYTLELTLSNGPTRNIRVTEPDDQHPSPEEHINSFVTLNLETAGFTPTLHILEGIAAEGKSWIHRDPHRPSPPGQR